MRHICCPCSSGTRTAQTTTVPMQSALMDMWCIGAVARLWNLAAFSLSVIAIVRCGKKTITLRCAAVIITILWIISIGMGLYILLPYVYETQFACPGCSLFP